jgi:hypothetical protein
MYPRIKITFSNISSETRVTIHDSVFCFERRSASLRPPYSFGSDEKWQILGMNLMLLPNDLGSYIEGLEKRDYR